MCYLTYTGCQIFNLSPPAVIDIVELHISHSRRSRGGRPWHSHFNPDPERHTKSRQDLHRALDEMAQSRHRPSELNSALLHALKLDQRKCARYHGRCKVVCSGFLTHLHPRMRHHQSPRAQNSIPHCQSLALPWA